MKYIIVFLLSFFTLLQASSNYPKLFSKQGTPLYKSVEKIKSFNKLSLLKGEVAYYLIKLDETKEIGIKADTSKNKADKMKYLKALRSLENIHNNVIKHSIKMLLDSIKENDYKEFFKIANAGIKYYSDKPRLKNKIVSYYKKHRHIKKSKTLDRVAKIYTKKRVKNRNNKRKNVVEKVEDDEWTYTIKSHISPDAYTTKPSSTK